MTPLRIMRHLKGTSQYRWAVLGRLMYMGLACAVATLAVDVARLRMPKRPAVPHGHDPRARAAARVR